MRISASGKSNIDRDSGEWFIVCVANTGIEDGWRVRERERDRQTDRQIVTIHIRMFRAVVSRYSFNTYGQITIVIIVNMNHCFTPRVNTQLFY